MFKWTVLNPGKIYEEGFPKVTALKRSTKGNMRSSCRKAPYT